MLRPRSCAKRYKLLLAKSSLLALLLMAVSFIFLSVQIVSRPSGPEDGWILPSSTDYGVGMLWELHLLAPPSFGWLVPLQLASVLEDL